jgi:hypothetical protein
MAAFCCTPWSTVMTALLISASWADRSCAASAIAPISPSISTTLAAMVRSARSVTVTCATPAPT